jgi:hypothetical protein
MKKVVLVFSLASLSFSPAAQARDATFGLAVSVVHRDGKPIRDEAWVRAQIDQANGLFSPMGIRFRWTLEGALPEKFAELHSPGDRDALAAAIEEPHTIPLFIVDVLEDVDEKGRLRMGVCWKKRYLIMASHARPTVLAHELGHFFGNGHSKVDDNLMSYSRTGGTVFLDARQSAIIGASSDRFLTSGLLKDVGPARTHP